MANVLVVGPHPDDQELGMGGTIALLAAQGHSVLLLDMTNGEPTPLGDPAARAKEAALAAEILGVRRVCLGLPNRELTHSIGARHAVAKVIREHQASIVFAPFFEDAHPDHVATTRIAEDARFDAKLSRMSEPGRWRGGDVLGGMPTALGGHGSHPGSPGHANAAIPPDRTGVNTPAREWFHSPPSDAANPPMYPKWFFYYYATHLRWVANPTFCMDVSAHSGTKLAAIRAYETQFVRANAHVVEWVEAAGVYFGSRIGARGATPRAEPFYSKEPMGLTGLTSLAL